MSKPRRGRRLAALAALAAPLTAAGLVLPSTAEAAPRAAAGVPAGVAAAGAPAAVSVAQAAALSGYVPAGPSGPGGSWGAPIVADAFTAPGGTLDRNLWGYGATSRPGNGSTLQSGSNDYEVQLYADTGVNVSAGNGLTLLATPASINYNGRRYPYLSGAINTHPYDAGNVGWTARRGFTFNPSKATFTVEASLQVDGDFAHVWPAFWFVPSSYAWPPEIDALEFLTAPADQQVPEAHVHWGADNQQAPYRGPAGSHYAAGYHKYTATMGPGGIFFFVDGREIGRMTDPRVLASVLNQDYYVILNQALTTSPNGANPAGVKAMRVRYFAAWERGRGGTTGGGYALGTGLAATPSAVQVRAVDNDLTGDRRADVSIFRPSTGQWWVRGQAPFGYGQNHDIPVNGHWAGAQAPEVPAVFRPSTGQWWIRGSAPAQYGQPGDVPVKGDYNGDGRPDIAVWRPSTGEWWLRGQGMFRYGVAGDIPVPGDYNGDGRADAAVYRPSTGQWWIRGIGVYKYGQAGDIAVPGDYNGDGRTDIAVYRPSTGQWWVAGIAMTQYGQHGDVPVPGDYNGDGRADVAVWRAGTRQWWIRGFSPIVYGENGDVPLELRR